MKRNLLLAVAFSLVLSGRSQPLNPPADEIYRPDELTWIFLTMVPADKAFLQDPANALSEEYKPAVFHFKNTVMDTTLSLAVDVRIFSRFSRTAILLQISIDQTEIA